MTGPIVSGAAAPIVTALRENGRGAVEIFLDGAQWRSVPVKAVYQAGIVVGGSLDRPAARALRREIRRSTAIDTAAAALRYRDRTAAAVNEHMSRAGIRPADRRAALATLRRAGVIDDERVALQRARALADRSAGDAMIIAELEREGVASAVAHETVQALEPEIARARAIVARRGCDARTTRYLAGKGFGEDAIEAVIAEQADEALG